MAKRKGPMLSLDSLSSFDEEFSASFEIQMREAIAHCRAFPRIMAARKLTIELTLSPSDVDPDDQEVGIGCSVDFPKISSKVAKRRGRSNGANQLLLDFDVLDSE